MLESQCQIDVRAFTAILFIKDNVSTVPEVFEVNMNKTNKDEKGFGFFFR